MDLGYNKLVLYPRPITLAKTYVRFYRCDGPYYMTEKTGKVFEVSSIDSKKTAFFAQHFVLASNKKPGFQNNAT